MNVQALQSIADSEDRFALAVGVLQKQFVGGVAFRIGRIGFCVLGLFIDFRVDIGLLPGRSTASQLSMSFISCPAVWSRGMRTGSPPACWTACSYCGIARPAYSASAECGMGMAMRGGIGFIVTCGFGKAACRLRSRFARWTAEAAVSTWVVVVLLNLTFRWRIGPSSGDGGGFPLPGLVRR